MSDASRHHPMMYVTYEKALFGGDRDEFDDILPDMDWCTCATGWFVYLPRSDFGTAFASRNDLPSTLLSRMAALDITPDDYTYIAGLGSIVRHFGAYAGDVSYAIELTQTEYDQLIAALGGENE